MTDTSDEILVTIVCKDTLLRAGLAATIANARGLSVQVIESESLLGTEAGTSGLLARSDVVVGDYESSLAVAQLTRRRGRHAPARAARTLLVSHRSGEADVRRALEAGVQGYLSLDCRPAELLEAIEAVRLGRRALGRVAAQRMAESFDHDGLTGRELDVLTLVASGDANKAIARKLGIAVGTVKVHLRSIMSKLDARTRTEVAAAALRRGLIDMEASPAPGSQSPCWTEATASPLAASSERPPYGGLRVVSRGWTPRFSGTSEQTGGLTMDRIQAMQVFVCVVETGSFTRTAENLAMQKAKVTRLVQWLEARLQTQLLHRTTRRVGVTTDGAAYYEQACKVLDDLNDIEAAMRRGRAAPSGRLRVDLGPSIGKLMIVPALQEFCSQHPEIRLELSAGVEAAELRRDGVDCGLRTGDIGDDSMVVRRVGMARFVTVASAGYLRERGVPSHPSELGDGHAVVRTLSGRTGQPEPMRFERAGELQEVTCRHRLAIGEGDALLDATLAGFGVAQVARCAAAPHLHSGALVELLPDWECPSLPLNVVYPPGQRQNARVRAFVAWTAEVFSRHPCVALPTRQHDMALGTAFAGSAHLEVPDAGGSEMRPSDVSTSTDWPP